MNKPRRITQRDVERKPESRDLRLSEYHQAVNWHFANAAPDLTTAEHDAAIREIAKRCGV